MAQASYFWTTNGTGDGTSGGYTAANFSQYLKDVAITSAASEGVLFGIDNNLAVSTTANPREVSIGTGAAIVNGKYYRNDSTAVTFTLGVSGSTRIDRVVLRGNFQTTGTDPQTIRIAVKTGTEGSPTPPALTQSDGNTWEIPLAQVLVTGANITSVTDQRTFAKSPAAYGWFNTPLTLNSTLNVSGSITTTGDLVVNGGDVRIGSDIDLRRTSINTLTIDDTVRIEHNTDGASGLFVINPSTGSSADARMIAEVSSSASSDPFAQFRVREAGSIVTYWTIGLDNSDSDKFKIVPDLNLGVSAAAVSIDPASKLVSLSSLSTSSGTITNATLGTATITTLSGTGIVNSDNIASGAVVNAKLGALAVDAAKIAANAVTSAKLAADAVVTTSISDNAVTSAKLAANSVVTTSIAANVVTSAKLASYSVVTTSVATNAITSVELAANAIVTTSITANVVTSAKLAANSVVTTSIATSAVTDAKIASVAWSKITSAPTLVGISGREGGNFDAWQVPGTTDYSSSVGNNQPYAKFGSYSLSFSSATSVNATIDYPGGGYSASPMVFVSMDTTNLDDMVTVAVKDVNASSFVIKAYAASAKSGTLVVYWMSVGV